MYIYIYKNTLYTICLSSYYYICVVMLLMCVLTLMLLYMCPHTNATIYVSSH